MATTGTESKPKRQRRPAPFDAGLGFRGFGFRGVGLWGLGFRVGLGVGG